MFLNNLAHHILLPHLLQILQFLLLFRFRLHLVLSLRTLIFINVPFHLSDDHHGGILLCVHQVAYGFTWHDDANDGSQEYLRMTHRLLHLVVVEGFLVPTNVYLAFEMLQPCLDLCFMFVKLMQVHFHIHHVLCVVLS